jgi:type II secretory pathway predicted ATPase ExeA
MNPFKPSFGKNPPQLIGRDDILANIKDALTSGADGEENASLVTGQRGMGKTVMLNALAKELRSAGWITVEVSNSDNMLTDIIDQIDDQVSGRKKHEITGMNLSVFGFGAGVQTAATKSGTGWRMRVTKRLRELSKQQIGVLFTIDEVHSDSKTLKEFALSYQHFVREDHKVAVAMAGLPSEISDLLQDKVLTFLRRAYQIRLSNIDIPEVEIGLLATIEKNDRTIGPRELRAAAEATEGYPYLIQLVGAGIWKVHPETAAIAMDDVTIGVAAARRKLYDNIIRPVYRSLSKKDKEFLRAMAEIPAESNMRGIGEKMAVSENYLSNYRQRLIDADVIYAAGRGEVDFVIPYLRNYLLEESL